MVPKRHVRRPESCALVQRQCPGVSSGRDHRRVPYPFPQEHLRGVTQEIATDSPAPPLLVDSKQTDPCRSGRCGRNIDVQRDIPDRGAVALGNDNVRRVPLNALLNPRGVQLIAARRVEVTVGVKPRVAV